MTPINPQGARDRGVAIRQARTSRVRAIRRRVVAGAVSLFLATWLLIAVVMASGNDPALAARKLASASTATGTTTATTATATGTGTGTGTTAAASGSQTGTATSGSASSSSSSSGSTSGSSGLTTRQS
jgi:hypothetical protein